LEKYASDDDDANSQRRRDESRDEYRRQTQRRRTRTNTTRYDHLLARMADATAPQEQRNQGPLGFYAEP